MRRWLRANRLGLTAIAVVVPLLAVVLIPVQLIDARPTIDIAQVRAGDRGQLDGLRYSVIAADEFGRSKDLTTPAGTTLVAAVVEVRPTGRRPAADACSFTLSAPGSDGRVTWSPELPFESARFGYRRGEDFADACDARPDGRYRAELVFLAPEGTSDTASIDVTLSSVPGRTQVLRLRLPTATDPSARS